MCVRFFLLLFVVMMLAQSTFAFQKKRMSEFKTSSASKAFRMAMNSNFDTILIDMKNSPYILEPLRFEGICDKVLILEEGVEILAKKGAFPSVNDALFKFFNCENIIISGQENSISMNKSEYTDGEWRHIFRLRGCKNITFDGLVLKNSGGDGITIGRSKKNLYSENITIRNLKSHNNKRQGLSIVSAKNVYVYKSEFSETKGTDPGAGVDIEPDLPQDVISNIYFKDCLFKDNYSAGAKVALGRLTSQSEPIHVSFENCVLENNFLDNTTKIPAEIIIKSNKIDPVQGQVIFKNCLVKNSKWRFLFARKNEKGFQVVFKNCAVKNVGRHDKKIEAIYLETPHYSKKSGIGGFLFEDLYLDLQNHGPIIKIRASRRPGISYVANLNANIFVRSAKQLTDPDRVLYINHNPENNTNVNIKITQRNSDRY